MSAGEIIAIVTAVSGVLVAVISSQNSARKTELETLHTLVDELRAQVDTMRGENERLRERVRELECENEALRTSVAALREERRGRKP